MASSSASARGGYHHGDLRAALVRAAGEIISEVGVANFSVAAAARRTGVSPGAPYRHFADRETLLAVVAVQASQQLAERYRQALGASVDPVEQLAGAAVAYLRFAAEARAGFDVIFSDQIDTAEYPDLRESRRALSNLLLPPIFALAPTAEQAIALGEAHIALVHGYAALLRHGFFKGDAGEVAERAATAVRTLVASYATDRGS
jgi:AcrR family transcriptional regulator